MSITDYHCLECGMVSDTMPVKSGRAHCVCGCVNDVWISKFSMAYVRHFLNKFKAKGVKP